LSLTYMAAGFDWQANYVAQAKDRDAAGKGKVDLFAWLTIANGGNQSFVNANTMAIAGSPNREERGEEPRPTGGELVLECWPMQRTHEVPYHLGFIPAPMPSPEAYYDKESASDSIVVTAQKMNREMLQSTPVAVTVAEQEDLGDLKLYRIPEPVTVNAKGQKQVALMVQPAVSFTHFYHANVDDGLGVESSPMQMLLRGANVKKDGLGLPMPSGQVLLYENSNFGPLIVNEAQLSDRAIGEVVEIAAGVSSDVRIALTPIGDAKTKRRFKVDITNARAMPVNVEVEIPYELSSSGKAIKKVDGVPTWKAVVPANGEATFMYAVKVDR
jgi:hypothetical protein